MRDPVALRSETWSRIEHFYYYGLRNDSPSLILRNQLQHSRRLSNNVDELNCRRVDYLSIMFCSTTDIEGGVTMFYVLYV